MRDAFAIVAIVLIAMFGIACASSGGESDTQRADQWFGAYAITALLAIILAALELIA